MMVNSKDKSFDPPNANSDIPPELKEKINALLLNLPH
jgi:hypothetical protein